MSRRVAALAFTLALASSACSSSDTNGATTGGRPGTASLSMASSIDLGSSFNGNYIWVHGVRSVAADSQYPCLNEFAACLPLDGSGLSAPVTDLCPSVDTPEGTWRFDYYLAGDASCAPLANIYCEVDPGEWLLNGSNQTNVTCVTSNANTTFDVCVYDPATGAGMGNCARPTGPNCQSVNGLTWCYNPDACGQACNDVCASVGRHPVADDARWFEAQNEETECWNLANAFGLSSIQMAGWTYACLEDDWGPHTAPGGLYGSMYCSMDPGCPSQHRGMMDQIGEACSASGGRRSICPCE